MLDEATASDKKSRSAVPANATSRTSRSRMTLKEQLDMSNPLYLEALKSRQRTAEAGGLPDYVNDNIVSIKTRFPHGFSQYDYSQAIITNRASCCPTN